MAHLIAVGNSQGLRIPQTLIKQAKLANKELIFKVTDEGLLIKPIENTPRAGWHEKITLALTSHSKASLTQEDVAWLDADLLDTDAVW